MIIYLGRGASEFTLMEGLGGCSSTGFGSAIETPMVLTTKNPAEILDNFADPGITNTYAFGEDLTSLLGTDPMGDWTVRFYDDAADDVGTLYYVQVELELETAD